MSGVVLFEELHHYQYQRLAYRRAGTRAFRQTFMLRTRTPADFSLSPNGLREVLYYFR